MAIAFGALIGLALGLLGGGGSILTVPIFVYVLHFTPKDAIAMSLAVVGFTSTVGAVGHWRAGNVNLAVGAVFGAVAMLGTFTGTRLAVYVSGAVQLAVFGAVMLAAAGVMFRGSSRTQSDMPTEAREGIGYARLAALALGVGLLTGLVGVGGGFLIVPALVMLALPMRAAVGTSLAIIAVNCVVGLAGSLGHAAIDWRAVLLVAGGTVPGMAFGVAVHHRVPQPVLRRGFSVFLLLMAAFILYQNAGTVLAGWSQGG